MILIQKGNKQLRVSEEFLESYLVKGYSVVEDFVEEDNSLFNCHYCEKVYKSQEKLDSHVQIKHLEQLGGGGKDGD